MTALAAVFAAAVGAFALGRLGRDRNADLTIEALKEQLEVQRAKSETWKQELQRALARRSQ